MNLRRTIHLLITSPARAIHRRGFGVQSPWAYELIRDVLFEPLPYYAYREQNLTTPLQQQLYRIRNHYRLLCSGLLSATASSLFSANEVACPASIAFVNLYS